LGSWDWRIRWCRESALNYFPVFKNLTYLFIDFGELKKIAMVILRQRKICFLNGFMAQELGKLEIAEYLKAKIPGLILPKLHSNPELGLKDLKNLQKTSWDLVIGLSMGGVYATKIKSKKTLLINPGFNIGEGIKPKYPEYSLGFKKLESLPDLAENVTGMIATDDKIRPITEPIFIEKYGKNNLINYPGKHVPEISELDKYIIPEIKKLL
jgi:hypothetical protein